MSTSIYILLYCILFLQEIYVNGCFLDAIGTKDDAAKPPGGWFDGLFGSDADTPEEEPLVEDDTPKKKTEEEEDAAELDGEI